MTDRESLGRGVLRIFSRGARVIVEIVSANDSVIEADLSDEEGYAAFRMLSKACYSATNARKQLTGATEWRCRVLVPNRATVQHDDHVTFFSRHVCGASKFKRVCASCHAELKKGDVYWREADDVERKTWSGLRLCDGCVRPETRAAGLLEGAKT